MALVKYNEQVLKEGKYTEKAEKRQGGTLSNWMLFEGSNGNWGIRGQATGDTNWPDGEWVRTSVIVSVDEEAGVAETLNTVYKLGTKLQA